MHIIHCYLVTVSSLDDLLLVFLILIAKEDVCLYILVLKRVLCSPRWLQTHFVAKDDFELLTFLPT